MAEIAFFEGVAAGAKLRKELNELGKTKKKHWKKTMIFWMKEAYSG